MFKYNSSQFALQKLITQVLQVVNLKFALIYRAAAVKKSFTTMMAFENLPNLLNWPLNLKLIFFFCSLKLSMMTPMKRLRVKKEPKILVLCPIFATYEPHLVC